MANEKEWVRLNVNIVMTADALQAIVANAKKKAGTDARGRYRVDTAESVSEIVSRFLSEKDFDTYARETEQ